MGISDRSKELHIASTNITDISSRVAAALQETAASTEEMTAVTEKNQKNSEEAVHGSAEAQRVATGGQTDIQSLIDSIRQLRTSSIRMSEIVSVIDDIAFQTNLLALNASVEAARAGEQGRGFAIVADAVRTLAQKAASSAKDIGELISANTSTAENGYKSADQSIQALEKMLLSISVLHTKINEVALASGEQSIGLRQISTAITEIDKSAQQNAAVSSNLTQLSENLDQSACRLHESLGELTKIVGIQNHKSTNFETKHKSPQRENTWLKSAS